MSTIPEALAKLEALGSPDHIALHLQSLGIRAKKLCPNSCAVAEYLTMETGSAEVVVITRFVFDASHGQFVSGCKVPDVVQKFIIAFDEGCYPELQR